MLVPANDTPRALIPGPTSTCSVSSCGVKYPVCGPNTAIGLLLAVEVAPTSRALLIPPGTIGTSIEPCGSSTLTLPCRSPGLLSCSSPLGRSSRGDPAATGSPVPGAVGPSRSGSATPERVSSTTPLPYGVRMLDVVGASLSFLARRSV